MMDVKEYLSREYPFNGMKISNRAILNEIEGRSSCSKCFKSRKYFCYTCNIPIDDLAGKLPSINVRNFKLLNLILHYKFTFSYPLKLI